jgi:hypothetical protein
MCLCVILCTVYVYSVYSITATGCQPICSLIIIIMIIIIIIIIYVHFGWDLVACVL